jgi:hypothetical protein
MAQHLVEEEAGFATGTDVVNCQKGNADEAAAEAKWKKSEDKVKQSLQKLELQKKEQKIRNNMTNKTENSNISSNRLGMLTGVSTVEEGDENEAESSKPENDIDKDTMPVEDEAIDGHDQDSDTKATKTNDVGDSDKFIEEDDDKSSGSDLDLEGDSKITSKLSKQQSKSQSLNSGTRVNSTKSKMISKEQQQKGKVESEPGIVAYARMKFIQFLQRSSQYSFQEILAEVSEASAGNVARLSLKFNIHANAEQLNSSNNIPAAMIKSYYLYEERIVLYAKLNQHQNVLNTYIFDLEDHLNAVRYCQYVFVTFLKDEEAFQKASAAAAAAERLTKRHEHSNSEVALQISTASTISSSSSTTTISSSSASSSAIASSSVTAEIETSASASASNLASINVDGDLNSAASSTGDRQDEPEWKRQRPENAARHIFIRLLEVIFSSKYRHLYPALPVTHRRKRAFDTEAEEEWDDDEYDEPNADDSDDFDDNPDVGIKLRKQDPNYISWQQRTVQILNAYWEFMDPVDVLSIAPVDMPLSCLCPFLTKSLPRMMHTKHQGDIILNLTKMNHFTTKMSLLAARSAVFHVKPESRCAECHKLIGDQTVFVIHPIDKAFLNSHLMHQKQSNNSNSHNNIGGVNNNKAVGGVTAKGSGSNHVASSSASSKDMHSIVLSSVLQHVVVHYRCAKSFQKRSSKVESIQPIVQPNSKVI